MFCDVCVDRSREWPFERFQFLEPKCWKFLRPICAVRSSFRDCFGCLDDNLLIKLYVGKYEAGKSHGIRFHQEEPM